MKIVNQTNTTFLFWMVNKAQERFHVLVACLQFLTYITICQDGVS